MTCHTRELDPIVANRYTVIDEIFMPIAQLQAQTQATPARPVSKKNTKKVTSHRLLTSAEIMQEKIEQQVQKMKEKKKRKRGRGKGLRRRLTLLTGDSVDLI